jgi:hypothetical protein
MTKQNVQKYDRLHIKFKYHIIIISEVHNIKTTKNCSRFSKKQFDSPIVDLSSLIARISFTSK